MTVQMNDAYLDKVPDRLRQRTPESAICAV